MPIISSSTLQKSLMNVSYKNIIQLITNLSTEIIEQEKF